MWRCKNGLYFCQKWTIFECVLPPIEQKAKFIIMGVANEVAPAISLHKNLVVALKYIIHELWIQDIRLLEASDSNHSNILNGWYRARWKNNILHYFFMFYMAIVLHREKWHHVLGAMSLCLGRTCHIDKLSEQSQVLAVSKPCDR